MMNGIDISGNQRGIDLSGVPCDFVIVKATQGMTFVNPEFHKQIGQAEQLGKFIGVYHYANGTDINTQVDHFIDIVRPYIGKAILVVDWEGYQNTKFSDYKFCEQMLVMIHEKTGVKPFLYMSKSVARQYKWEIGRQFPFWCAQYANKNIKYAYESNPWTDAKGWGAWTGCKIYQYSSRGRLGTYKADLDINLAYMDGSEWLEWAKGETHTNIDLNLKPTLKRGDRNEYVRAWQVLLNQNGYSCGNADGIFGQRTQDALIRWQQDHGIEAGYVGELTWNTV